MKDKRFKNKNNCICYFNSSENKWYIESSNGSLKFSSESDHPFSKFVNVSNPSQEIKNFPGKISFSDTDACNGTFAITGFDENNIPIYKRESNDEIVVKFTNNKWNVINETTNETILVSNEEDEFGLINNWINESTQEIIKPSISEEWDQFFENESSDNSTEPLLGDGSLENPYLWSQIANGSTVTTEGLQMISSDSKKFVLVELIADEEYEFKAYNDVGDSYLILTNINGERLNSTDWGYNEDGYEDDVSIVELHFKPTTNGKYLICYTEYYNNAEGESNYCNYTSAIINPPPTSKEEIVEKLAQQALDSVASSSIADEIITIKNEFTEISNLLAQIIENKEAEE